jgi:hypothetical protein
MSATNAIAAISLVGSLVVAGADYSEFERLGLHPARVHAVTCSSTNAVCGFLTTDRMLRMFKTAEERARKTRRPVELQALGFVLAVAAVVSGLLYLPKPADLTMGTFLREHVAPEALRYCYIVSAAMFVLGLKGLSSPSGRAREWRWPPSACSSRWSGRSSIPHRDVSMDRARVRDRRGGQRDDGPADSHDGHCPSAPPSRTLWDRSRRVSWSSPSTSAPRAPSAA